MPLHSTRVCPTLLALCAGAVSLLAAASPRAWALAPEAQAVEQGRAASEVLLAEGMLAFEEGRDAEARQVLAEAAAADPQNGTALHWLGLADLRLGRAGEAAGALAAALAAGRPPEAGRRRVAADLAAARRAAGRAGPGSPGGAEAQSPPPPAVSELPVSALPAPAADAPAASAPVIPAPPVSAPPVSAPPVSAPPVSAPAVPTPEVLAPPYPGGPLLTLELPPRWEGRLSIEGAYDSNPGLLPADATFLPFNGKGPSRVAGDGAGDADLRLEAHPFDDRGGWRLGLGVVGNRSAYGRTGDLDLGLAGAFAQLGWGRDPHGYLTGPLGYLRVPAGSGRLGLLVQAAETWTWLGGQDYLRLAAGGAALSVNGPGPTATRIDVSASRLSFAGDSSGDLRRSGNEIAAELSEALFAGGRGGYFRLALGGGERTAGRAFAHRFVQAGADAAAPLGARSTLYLQAVRREERLDHAESNLTRPAGPARADRSWRASAALVRMLGQRLAATVRAGYVRRDSNVTFDDLPLFDYRRTVAGLGIS